MLDCSQWLLLSQQCQGKKPGWFYLSSVYPYTFVTDINNAGIMNGTKTLLLTLMFFFFEAWLQNIFNLQIWQLPISWCCSVTTTFNIHMCYISSKSWSGIFIWNPDILTLFWRPFYSFCGNSLTGESFISIHEPLNFADRFTIALHKFRICVSATALPFICSIQSTKSFFLITLIAS